MEKNESLSSEIDEITIESQQNQQPFKVKGGKTYAFFKRFLDIFCSFLAIIILSPIMLIVAVIIKCTSKGPIIYVSDRIGKDGKPFRFYKFRSMRVGADKELYDLLDKNEVKDGPIFKMKHDPRITKFGRFIRKTSLDELPQLFNILKGDMSIVGPRPCTVREYNEMMQDPELTDYITKKVLVKQGLTCLWQCSGRSNCGFSKMRELDLEYIQHKRGFWYDLWIIIKTGFVVMTGKGAE